MAIRTYTVGDNAGVRRLDALTAPWIDIPLNLLTCTGAPINGVLRDVMTDPVNEDKVFAVGNRDVGSCEPGIYWSNDAGVTWNKAIGDVATAGPNAGTTIWELWAVDTNIIYATSNYGYCFKSVDGGVTFDHTAGNPIVTGFPVGNEEYISRAIHFPDAMNGVVSQELSSQFIVITADGGATWSDYAFEAAHSGCGPISGIHMSTDYQTIVVQTRFGIYRSTDGGASYVNVYTTGSDPFLYLLHLTWTDDANLWAYGLQGLRIRSTNGGATWVVINAATPTGPSCKAGHHYQIPDGFFSENLDILRTTDSSVTGTFSETSPYGVEAVWTSIDQPDPDINCYLAINCEDPTNVMLITIDPTLPPLDLTATYVFVEFPDECWTIEISTDCGNDPVDAILVNTGFIDAADTLGVQDQADFNWTLVLGDVPVPTPAIITNQAFPGYGSLFNALWINQIVSPHFIGHLGLTEYETTFTLPLGFNNPSLVFDILSDITAVVTLNGYVIGDTTNPASYPNPLGVPANFSTSNPIHFNANPGVNILNVAVRSVGQEISGFALAGTITSTGSSSVSTPVTVQEIFIDCDDCLGICYELTDCEGLLDPIQTDTDLSAYVGSVVHIATCPDVCWIVAELPECPREVIAVVVTADFPDCVTCLPSDPPPPPLVIRNRTVKPGYNTVGCSPEYVARISCEWSEALFQQAASKRYGIDFCCTIEFDGLDIKKQLLDLKMITDPDACKPAPCCAPCNTTAELLTFSPVSCPAPISTTAILSVDP